MAFDDHGRVPIRSYRVVFRLERRIFQVDRFRLPFPYGVEVRAIAYGVCSYLTILLVTGLPLIGAVFGLLPAPVHWGLLPLGVVFALIKLRIDGRPPHKVLSALIRWSLGPKHLAGLRVCPPPGFRFSPLNRLWMRPDWRFDTYRRAVIRGPAKVTLRYPATVEATNPLLTRWRTRQRRPQGGRVVARRLIIRQRSQRPMYVGKTVEIPRSGGIEFR
jgi:hypothetical protein